MAEQTAVERGWPAHAREPAGDAEPDSHADAVIVGAGPAGSAAATFLAQAGRDVVLLEKSPFPREKVCGDALTPRAVKALQLLGLHEEAEGRPPGWSRQMGLRMYGGGVVLDLPWPQLRDYPAHSVTATRAVFDHTLAQNAVAHGAQLWEGAEAIEPVWLTRARERVAGVRYQRADGRHGVVRAPIVVATDGNSSRIAIAAGLHRDRKRPMGVAIRAYYRSPRASMDMMEGFLEMRVPPAGEGERQRAGGRGSGGEGERQRAGGRGSGGEGERQRAGGRGSVGEDGEANGELLPGYGWIFPLDGGLVNIGWGLLDSSAHFRSTNYRRVLERWVASLPAGWELHPGTLEGRPRSAGLPMAHNRRPIAERGLVLVGDAAGMVNPFNGEGISYAIEAAALAAEAIDRALERRSDAPLGHYPKAVADAWGGYYTLGRAFVSLMGHPAVMRACTVYGMPRMKLMHFVFRTMAHLINRRADDATDAILNMLSRAVPAA